MYLRPDVEIVVDSEDSAHAGGEPEQAAMSHQRRHAFTQGTSFIYFRLRPILNLRKNLNNRLSPLSGVVQPACQAIHRDYYIMYLASECGSKPIQTTGQTLCYSK